MNNSTTRVSLKTGFVFLLLSLTSLSFAQNKPNYGDLVLDVLNLKNQISSLKLAVATASFSGDLKSFSDKCGDFTKEQQIYKDNFDSARQYAKFVVRKPNNREERYLQSSIENLLMAIGDRAAVISTLCKTEGAISDGHSLYISLALLASALNSTQNAGLFEELAELVSN